MAQTCLKEIDVVILAGGLGTRLAGDLNGKPKLMAPIGGKPYLDFALTWVSFFGAKRIVLALGHLAAEVETYVDDRFYTDLEIVCTVEPEPLGTAGGLAYACEAVYSDQILVMNGDSFVDADLCALMENHCASQVDGTLLCTLVQDTSRYGAVDLDDRGRIVGFREKTGARGPGRINAGIYAMSAPLIDQVKELGRGSLEQDVFQKMPAGSLNAFSGAFLFLDIGTPEDYAKAPAVFAPYLNRWSGVAL